MERMENCEKARLMFARGATIKQIADELGVPLQTVYSWKKKDDDKEKGWDSIKRLYNMSTSEMVNLYAESVKGMIILVSEDPLKLADPKYADAISKNIASLKKIDPFYNYLGAALDLIKVTDDYLKKADPELAQKMHTHWPKIKEELEAFSTRDGLFG